MSDQYLIQLPPSFTHQGQRNAKRHARLSSNSALRKCANGEHRRYGGLTTLHGVAIHTRLNDTDDHRFEQHLSVWRNRQIFLERCWATLVMGIEIGRKKSACICIGFRQRCMLEVETNDIPDANRLSPRINHVTLTGAFGIGID